MGRSTPIVEILNGYPIVPNDIENDSQSYSVEDIMIIHMNDAQFRIKQVNRTDANAT